MRIRYTLTTLLVACTLILAGCDSGGANEPEDPSIQGRWEGTSNVEGSAFTLNLTLAETEGSGVTGSGTLTGAQSLALEASGTYNYPNVSLTLSSDCCEDMNFSGDMAESGGSISGELNGSGFTNAEVTITRE